MNEKRDYTTLEIFSIAIKSEIEAAKLYNEMKKITKNSILKDKFDFLISQEKKHEQILKEAYEKNFPDVELKSPPNSPVPLTRDIMSESPSLKELFEIAMSAEKMAGGYYNDLAKRTNNPSSKSLLLYMAKMERSHLALLEVEYEQLESGADIDSDDFLRGERLMNMGP
ncbi:MAG TPA: ferritin family protein [Candidatus Krumholzibacteriaceae bacterium]|nr:ferritin family protein [Candidatus Krumholzibacteriaceae bacterium]